MSHRIRFKYGGAMHEWLRLNRPYRMTIKHSTTGEVRREIMAWCDENVGLCYIDRHEGHRLVVDPTAPWGYYHDFFYFQTEKDALFFKLRWADVIDHDCV